MPMRIASQWRKTKKLGSKVTICIPRFLDNRNRRVCLRRTKQLLLLTTLWRTHRIIRRSFVKNCRPERSEGFGCLLAAVIPTAQARTYIPRSARDDKWVWSPLYLKKGGGLLIICEFQWFRTGVEARALHWLLVS